MKIKEIREKTEKELNRFLAEKREKLREYNFKLTSEQLKNHRERRKAKRDVARILTVLNEHRLQKELKNQKNEKKQEEN